LKLIACQKKSCSSEMCVKLQLPSLLHTSREILQVLMTENPQELLFLCIL